jgi:hypothetical protein
VREPREREDDERAPKSLNRKERKEKAAKDARRRRTNARELASADFQP